jgi:tripartite-type tricarboxylate transporter receptor subunit TctC
MKLTRFFSMRLLATAALLSAAATSFAQTNYPTKTVNVVTAFPVGSGPDTVLRLVADKLSKMWNQPVTVANKPGGGGFVAIDGTKTASADGYTLLQLDSEHLGALPHLYKSKNFITLNTFDPVATLFRTPFFVAVPTDSKWQNMRDLVMAAKAAPGKINLLPAST